MTSTTSTKYTVEDWKKFVYAHSRAHLVSSRRTSHGCAEH